MKNFGYAGAARERSGVSIIDFAELRRQAARNYPGGERAERRDGLKAQIIRQGLKGTRHCLS
ncbi:hypothetical protein [Acetomicrobium sp.]|uniref:hypothetical protein n=1 Tax=Acetomicrobium sp. TaxID=1872099 RepID=UPI002FCC9F7B